MAGEEDNQLLEDDGVDRVANLDVTPEAGDEGADSGGGGGHNGDAYDGGALGAVCVEVEAAGVEHCGVCFKEALVGSLHIEEVG